MGKPKIAFVVQRYGESVGGGAETLCRVIAERMSSHWAIDVITSCAMNYVNRFENEFPSAVEVIHDVTVRRFGIDYLRSDNETFSRLDRKVLRREATREEEILWLKEIGPYSSSLLKYVTDFQHQYDLFFFFTYLYATTTLVLPAIREKSFLVPAAHDEPPIHARFFDDFFSLPKGLIFSTEEELAFLRKRTSGRMAGSFVVGVGVDPPKHLSPDLFRNTYRTHGTFLLYVGRVQKQKGCDELFEFYSALPLEVRRSYPLVLIGKSAMHIPENEYIIPLGFVSDEMKYSAMCAAELLIMPSKFESLNMVILESWLCGTPVLVNGRCDVLRGHCQRSHGGLWYTSFEEFQVCLEWMLADKNLLEILAENGRKYTGVQYSWDRVKRQYVGLVEDVLWEAHREASPDPLLNKGGILNGHAQMERD